jgi:hypothetical protein
MYTCVGNYCVSNNGVFHLKCTYFGDEHPKIEIPNSKMVLEPVWKKDSVWKGDFMFYGNALEFEEFRTELAIKHPDCIFETGYSVYGVYTWYTQYKNGEEIKSLVPEEEVELTIRGVNIDAGVLVNHGEISGTSLFPGRYYDFKNVKEISSTEPKPPDEYTVNSPIHSRDIKTIHHLNIDEPVLCKFIPDGYENSRFNENANL